MRYELTIHTYYNYMSNTKSHLFFILIFIFIFILVMGYFGWYGQFTSNRWTVLRIILTIL